MPRALFIALSNPTSPAEAEEFGRWYEHTHIPELLANVDRLVSGTRYSVPDIQMLPTLPKSEHRFMAVYEVDADSEADFEATADELRKALTSGILNMSPTLDLRTALTMFAMPTGPRQTRDGE